MAGLGPRSRVLSHLDLLNIDTPNQRAILPARLHAYFIRIVFISSEANVSLAQWGSNLTQCAIELGSLDISPCHQSGKPKESTTMEAPSSSRHALSELVGPSEVWHDLVTVENFGLFPTGEATIPTAIVILLLVVVEV